MEIAVLGLFTKLLDTNGPAAFAIFILDARTQRDVVHVLGRQHLTGTEFAMLDTLVKRRLGGATTTRNRIVHGAWTLEIRVSHRDDGTESGRSARWVRFYQPSDPVDMDRMLGRGRDRALIAAHRFTAKDLEQAAERAYELFKAIEAFTATCRLGPPPNPQPIKLS